MNNMNKNSYTRFCFFQNKVKTIVFISSQEKKLLNIRMGLLALFFLKKKKKTKIISLQMFS